MVQDKCCSPVLCCATFCLQLSLYVVTDECLADGPLPDGLCNPMAGQQVPIFAEMHPDCLGCFADICLEGHFENARLVCVHVPDGTDEEAMAKTPIRSLMLTMIWMKQEKTNC